jgi:hypothetical protein
VSEVNVEVQARIHIDREPYRSANPTMGAALYALAEVPPHLDLFREVGGDHEDELVPRDETPLLLIEDEHFYSQRTITIIVDAEEKEVTKRRLSFDDLVKLAYPVPPLGTNLMYTIAYRNGPPQNPKGHLLEGESVFVKNGMIFDVTPTDRS